MVLFEDVTCYHIMVLYFQDVVLKNHVRKCTYVGGLGTINSVMQDASHLGVL